MGRNLRWSIILASEDSELALPATPQRMCGDSTSRTRTLPMSIPMIAAASLPENSLRPRSPRPSSRARAHNHKAEREHRRPPDNQIHRPHL